MKIRWNEPLHEIAVPVAFLIAVVFRKCTRLIIHRMKLMIWIGTTQGESGESHPTAVATHVITVRYSICIEQSSSRSISSSSSSYHCCENSQPPPSPPSNAPPSFIFLLLWRLAGRNIREAMKGENQMGRGMPRLHYLLYLPYCLLLFILLLRSDDVYCSTRKWRKRELFLLGKLMKCVMNLINDTGIQY